MLIIIFNSFFFSSRYYQQLTVHTGNSSQHSNRINFDFCSSGIHFWECPEVQIQAPANHQASVTQTPCSLEMGLIELLLDCVATDELDMHKSNYPRERQVLLRDS